MRISDWSSDVCSSDLVSGLADQWLAEGQVEVDRTGSRPGGLGVGARCQCPPASGTLLVGDAWRVEPANGAAVQVRLRSEERRVGKERFSTGRSRWSPDQ